MPTQTRIVSPGGQGRAVKTDAGQTLFAPADWALLPPGDAGLTRRVKAAGPTWTVQEKVGRKTFSRGVWAPAATIEAARARLAAERDTPQYARKREGDARRRDEAQGDYVVTFRASVLEFLAFHPTHAPLAAKLAEAVTAHATPVGSGTVARTKRIPVERRAEAAVIAWMRHATTGYDGMSIACVKGKRREVRRMLAERSRTLLDGYRAGRAGDAKCPLRAALLVERLV